MRHYFHHHTLKCLPIRERTNILFSVANARFPCLELIIDNRLYRKRNRWFLNLVCDYWWGLCWFFRASLRFTFVLSLNSTFIISIFTQKNYEDRRGEGDISGSQGDCYEDGCFQGYVHAHFIITQSKSLSPNFVCVAHASCIPFPYNSPWFDHPSGTRYNNLYSSSLWHFLSPHAVGLPGGLFPWAVPTEICAHWDHLSHIHTRYTGRGVTGVVHSYHGSG